MGATMNGRTVKAVIGIGVLCSCTNQAPAVGDVALEQSALTFEVDRGDDVSALKAVLFGVGRSTLVSQFWGRGSLPVRSDPRYVELAEAVIAEVARRDPDLVSDFNEAIESGDSRALDREIERAQESIAEILGDRSDGDIDLDSARTVGGSGTTGR